MPESPMDDEGRRLAGMNDEEWAERMRGLERDLARQRTTSPSGLPGRRVVIGSAAAALTVAAFVLAYLVSHSSTPTRTTTPPRSDAARVWHGTPAATWNDAATALQMPTASRIGPYPASVVAGALSRSKAYLLTARTSSSVLSGHDLSALKRLVSPTALKPGFAQGGRLQETLGATFLAPRNHLASSVRLAGTVKDSYVPAHGHIADHLAVTANVVWAYALIADYSVAPIPYDVVALRERVQLDFYLGAHMDGPLALPVPTRDQVLYFDADCGYFDQALLGLPRVDDPGAIAGNQDTHSAKDAFDPNSPVPTSSHQCKTS